MAHFACLGRHTHGIRLGQSETFKSKHGVGNVFARDCVLVVVKESDVVRNLFAKIENDEFRRLFAEPFDLAKRL